MAATRLTCSLFDKSYDPLNLNRFVMHSIADSNGADDVRAVQSASQQDGNQYLRTSGGGGA